ncbi:MAG: hypothetical protein ACRDTC_19520 [Pseudonocardiaceae bacterium]
MSGIEQNVLIAGRYRLIAQAGAGARDVVWQAHDERLHHLSAITVYDVARHEDRPCLIREYVPSRIL